MFASKVEYYTNYDILRIDKLNSAKIDRKTKLPDHIQITWIPGSDFKCAEI
tara:strand:+ start:2411 stop:2563 length:153 start_codon:yes stop_codon:yes gene_type:complete